MQDAGIAARRKSHRRVTGHFVGFLIVLIRLRGFRIIRHLFFHQRIVFSLNLLVRKGYVLKLIVLQQFLHVSVSHVLAQEFRVIFIGCIVVVQVVGRLFKDELHRACIHINGGVAFRFGFGL